MAKEFYKKYLLALLMTIYVSNHLDRIALGLLMQDIKVDLSLSDTELGLLSGIAFAVFYALMGIPIARWADRGDRVFIISSTTALWSFAVAACAAVMSFPQFLLVRICVAVGEAGCIPPAHSLIADFFTRKERPRAVARYVMGGSVAFFVGYFGAGWLNEFYGWRMTFVVLGLPGVVLAALAWFTLKEPRRGRDTIEQPAVDGSSASVPVPGVKEVCVTLWANQAFRNLLLCYSVWYFFGYGLMQWLPTFFIRSHAVTTGEIGTWFALIHGAGGALGIYVGGELASRFAPDDEARQLRAGAVAFVFFGLLTACSLIAADYHVALGAMALASLGGYMAQGPVLATIQTLVSPRTRATAIAIIYLFANLIGYGLGPFTAGVLSDVLRPQFAEESLRYALVILCPGYFWAAWHLVRASRTVGREIGEVRAAPPALARASANQR